MNSFIDIHQHLLFGLDDGPINRTETQKMLQVAYHGGVRTIIATPHIFPGLVPFSADIIHSKVKETQDDCRRLGVDMQILPGAEMMYTYQAERYLAEHRIPTMAGSSKVLIEFAPNVRFDELESAIQVVLRSGHIPILAHIERYACLMYARRRAFQLQKEYDVQYQINCECLLSGVNYFVRQTLKCLLQEAQINFVASDAHNTVHRPCRMQEAYDKLAILVGNDYADELTGNHETIIDFFDK